MAEYSYADHGWEGPDDLDPYISRENGKYVAWYECSECGKRIRYIVDPDSLLPQTENFYCEGKKCKRETVWDLIRDPRRYGD